MNIEAAVLTQPNTPLDVMDLTLQEPSRGEVLVKLAASGVCHSDYHLISGATKHPLPAVLGHEGAGIVERVGTGVTKVKPGNRAVMTFRSCGSETLPISKISSATRSRSAVALSTKRRLLSTQPWGSPYHAMGTWE